MRCKAIATLCACGLLASGCGRPGEVRPIFPSRADLAVEAEPVPGNDIVTDPAADERFRAEHEAWGRRGWAAVARLCRFNKALGMPVDCPEGER